jgi:hypothetical protein
MARTNYPWGTSPRTNIQLEVKIAEAHFNEEHKDLSKMDDTTLWEYWKGLRHRVSEEKCNRS